MSGEILYALDEPEVMLPRDLCPTSSKARYRGWRELHDACMVDAPFDPREVTVRARYMARVTASPWVEMTHRFVAADVPGASLYWHVRVDQ